MHVRWATFKVSGCFYGRLQVLDLTVVSRCCLTGSVCTVQVWALERVAIGAATVFAWPVCRSGDWQGVHNPHGVLCAIALRLLKLCSVLLPYRFVY